MVCIFNQVVALYLIRLLLLEKLRIDELFKPTGLNEKAEQKQAHKNWYGMYVLQLGGGFVVCYLVGLPFHFDF